jgi:hypothetical protein
LFLSNFSKVTNASNAFYGCKNISLDSIQHLLKELVNATNLASFLCLGFNGKDE